MTIQRVPSELQKHVFDGLRLQYNNAMYVLSSASPARIPGIHDLTIPEQCDCPSLVFLSTRGALVERSKILVSAVAKQRFS